MPIRITGLNSGLDTEALVSELVSAYRKKTEKYTKAQTKLSWKQDAWKDLNTKINKFYSSIRSLKYTSSYNSKKATISDTTKATVTAKNGVATGTYELKINKVAKAGYLTGGKLADRITESSTMSELGYSGKDGKITVTSGGKTTDINVTGQTTVSDFIKSLNEAGVNASFDSTNHRIFVSAKKSGIENDFTLTGVNANGNDALSKLGLSIIDGSEKDVYKTYAAFARNENGDPYITYDATGKALTNGVYSEAKTRDYINQAKQDLMDNSVKLTEANAKVNYAKAYQIISDPSADTSSAEYTAARTLWDGYTDATGRQEIIDAYAADSSMTSYLSDRYNEIDKYQEYFDNNSLVLESNSDMEAFVSKVNYATDFIASNRTIDPSKGANRVYGQDTEIELNGATFTSSNSEITINGLTINTLNTTKEGENLSINVTNDSQGMYDKIKGFIKEYNEIINEMTKLYNADSAKGYEPLTTEEKDSLTDKEVEEWEKKIKDSVLRRDDSVNQMMTIMKNAMFKTYSVNGKNYSLASFGISTISILNATKNEENAFHIDGDSEDTEVSGKTDKLMAALQDDPEVVADFMMQLATGLYDEIGKKMSSSRLSSFGVVYNDKEMAREYSDYTKTISKWEKKLKDIEESYYKKFAAMESALATLQSQQSSLANLFA